MSISPSQNIRFHLPSTSSKQLSVLLDGEMVGGTGTVMITSGPHLQSLCNLQGGCLSRGFTGPGNCHHHLVDTKAQRPFLFYYKYFYLPSIPNLFLSRQHFQKTRAFGAWHPLSSEQDLVLGGSVCTGAMGVKKYMWPLL